MTSAAICFATICSKRRSAGFAVDTGYAGGFSRFARRFTKLAPLSELKYVFLTHAHDDHAGYLSECCRPAVQGSSAMLKACPFGVWRESRAGGRGLCQPGRVAFCHYKRKRIHFPRMRRTQRRFGSKAKPTSRFRRLDYRPRSASSWTHGGFPRLLLEETGICSAAMQR
jgi:hypothetical protein